METHIFNQPDSGLVPLGIGSDGGGSIRIPASFCGLVGLKPKCGRVPSEGIDEIIRI